MTSVREVWAAGDYPAVARFITSAADACVRAAARRPGDHVLDVACGNGNAAIAAARAGGIATGVDITPELLDAARAVAPDVEWIEGDAQDLPFDDDSFDVVLSTFGCDVRARPPAGRRRDRARRAPRRPDRDRELDAGGRRSATSSARSPRTRPPPPGDSPLLWGTEAHLRELFPERVLSFERQAVTLRVRVGAGRGRVLLRQLRADRGRPRAASTDEAALLDDLRAMFAEHGADDGPYPGEYLMAVART